MAAVVGIRWAFHDFIANWDSLSLMRQEIQGEHPRLTVFISGSNGSLQRSLLRYGKRRRACSSSIALAVKRYNLAGR